jgi:hypothetical protein
MNKILTVIVSTAAVASAAFATGPSEPAKKSQMNWSGGKWSIRAFYGFASGDIKDDIEVDSVFGAGLEYSLPNMGGANPIGGNFSIGAEYSGSSEGVLGFNVVNYGIYGGFSFPLGQNTGMGGLEAILRLGYFNTRFENDITEDDRWGFGFDAGLRYKIQKFWLELFYRQRPSLDSVSNNSIAIGVSFPIGN